MNKAKQIKTSSTWKVVPLSNPVAGNDRSSLHIHLIDYRTLSMMTISLSRTDFQQLNLVDPEQVTDPIAVLALKASSEELEPSDLRALRLSAAMYAKSSAGYALFNQNYAEGTPLTILINVYPEKPPAVEGAGSMRPIFLDECVNLSTAFVVSESVRNLDRTSRTFQHCEF